MMLLKLNTAPTNAGQLLLFDLYRQPKETMLDYDRIAKLKAEVDMTGIPFSVHPAVYLDTEHVLAAELYKHVEREVTIAGFIATARTARTEDGRTMAFATIEDASGLAEVSFFPNKIDDYYKICSASGAVWAKGVVNEHLSSITIDCRNCGRIKIPA